MELGLELYQAFSPMFLALELGILNSGALEQLRLRKPLYLQAILPSCASSMETQSSCTHHSIAQSPKVVSRETEGQSGALLTFYDLTLEVTKHVHSTIYSPK